MTLLYITSQSKPYKNGLCVPSGRTMKRNRSSSHIPQDCPSNCKIPGMKLRLSRGLRRFPNCVSNMNGGMTCMSVKIVELL